jgi:hypothetical protein
VFDSFLKIIHALKTNTARKLAGFLRRAYISTANCKLRIRFCHKISPVMDKKMVERLASTGLKFAASLVLLMLLQPVPIPGQKAGREEGEYRIFIGGKEIGSEKYVIVSSPDSSTSSSTLDFRDPAGGHRKAHFETKLEADMRYVPRSYELKSEVDGQKGSIIGSFPINEAMFEYRGGPAPRKTGLLVGNEYTLLDTNIFHHFVFIARLFNFESKEKTQKFEVVIPQEADSGFLKVQDLKREVIVVRGKKMEMHRLLADSGQLTMQLWVDDQHVLHKIAVKDKGIEVIRNP